TINMAANNIDMDGRQSFLLNDIKNVLRNGGNVTHILNVELSRQMDKQTGDSIRNAIFQRIRNNPIQKVVHGVHVTITWRTSASSSSAYYHADVPYFTDLIVKRHTEQLLQDLLEELNGQFNNIFMDGMTGLAFLISKPLTREVVIDD
ncbi:hypothetical protein HDV05_000948, partial [Chytridiales sp. JEL 0842]